MKPDRPSAGRRGATALLTLGLAALLVATTGAGAAAAVQGDPSPEPTQTQTGPSSESTSSSGSEGSTLSSAEAGELRQELVDIYALNTEFLALAGASDATMPSVEQYRSDVMAASEADLAPVHEATRELAQWPQLPAMLETMITSLPESASQVVEFSGGAPRPRSDSTVSSNRAVPAFEVDGTKPVTLRSAASCEYSHIPAAAVFATQIILDVAETAGEILDLVFEKVDGTPVVEDVIYALTVVAKSVAGVAAVITDTLAYLRTLNDDCNFSDVQAFAKNIDNTTVATFNLVGSLGAALARIETTSTSTLAAVQALDADVASLSVDVRSTLEHNLSELQSSIGGSTQLNVSNLQLLQTALRDGLVTLSSGVVAAKDEILADDGATEAELQAMLTDSLTRTLAEIDRTTGEVRGNLDERSQLIMNAVEQDATTSRTEYLTDLRLSIEQAMTSGQRRTLLRLPAAKGGLLDATPVGVQVVVNDGMDAMLEIGASIEPSAVKALNDGNQAVTERRWLAAYGHFESAYQGMINAK